MRTQRLFFWSFAFLLVIAVVPVVTAQCIPQYPENVCPCGNGTCDPDEDRMSCPQDCPVGCNLDTVCETEFGEDPQTCPHDCDTVCEESCDGRCGQTEICGQGVIDCPCVTCGDERCDPGEDCPEDCGSNCVSVMPLFSASANAAQVGQSITFTADPSRALLEPVPQWDMGNGVHLTGSQINYAYPVAGTFPVILTASETACERTVDSDPVFVTISDQPISCDLEGIPPSAQRCCGDGTCQGGETPDDCSSDCPAWCGDQHCSVTQGEDLASCPTDCCPSGTVCAAGCAPIPTFTISNTQPARFAAVTFAANASQVEGSVVNWDFGDGHHCEGCPLTTTHRYELQGSYPVRLTVTENVCGSTKVSVPWTINVGPQAPEPWAQVVASGLPSCVTAGEPAAAWVQLRNTGGTTWGPLTGDTLRLMSTSSADPSLFAPVDVPIPWAVPPGQQIDLRFNFGALQQMEGEYTLVYRMVNAYHYDYGDPLVHSVRITSEPCASVPSAGDYTCRASLRTAAGDPVPRIRAQLELYAMGLAGEETLDIAEQLTDAQGVANLSRNRLPHAKAVRVTCRFLDVLTTTPPEITQTHPTEVPPTHLVLDRVLMPAFSGGLFLPGRKPGQAFARLFQTGPYDKPIVIPMPFDIQEQTGNRFTGETLRRFFDGFLRAAEGKGYDVWLTHTISGQNIHEQAAEFAQLIDLAARLLGPGGRVAVAGYSLGGVTARLATARYQADPAWRIELGLQATLPVNLIAFGDAPLLGAHIPYRLQQAAWQDMVVGGRRPYAEGNLNSCGAQQLLRRSYPSGTDNFDNFWNLGQPVRFPKGVCDRIEADGTCQCEAGPALLSLNGNGWASGVPIVAFSDGYPGPQACYGDERDLDSSKTKTVCPDLWEITAPFDPVFPFEPQVGTPMFRIEVPLASDFTIYATAADILPGSRLSNASREQECGYLLFCGGVKQYFSPVFIPFESALPAGAPFSAAWHTPGYNAVHAVGVEANIEALFEQLDAAFGGRTAAVGPASLSLDDAGTMLELRFPTLDHMPQVTPTLTVVEVGAAPPPGFVHGSAPRFYNVQADLSTAKAATSREPITACVSYADLSFMDEQRLALFHHEAVGWVDVTSHVDTEAKRVCGNVRTIESLALFEPLNRNPIVMAGEDQVVVATRPEGGDVVVVPSGTHDPDEEPVTYAWREEGEQTIAETATLTRVLPVGTHELTLTVRDSRGGEASDALTVTVTEAPPTFVSEYTTGTWSGCSGEESWTCLSEGQSGCSRPGTQTRTVTPVAWTADPASEATEPPSSQTCTETTPGYVSAYEVGAWGGCAGTQSWTCTSASGTGCSRPGTEARAVTATSWTADSSQAQSPPTTSQACTQTTQGYVASYSVGSWNACSSTCGSGNQTRSVIPNGYTASAPGVSAPDSVQACTGESCTCDDMGWYAGDERSQCDSDCGQACTKKQWCGSNECQPWPHYCWKC
ncbi:MAG: PKD domain-containing protein [Vicinamibacteria bacterium]|nr:PKD domain-containing protein [Vicinamibacteria bacterium]